VDGLGAIRSIVEQVPRHLDAGGWLLLEHGHDQAQRVRALLTDAGFAQIQSRRDLAGIDRVTIGQLALRSG
jgi:release factor glutamine methyltransferase